MNFKRGFAIAAALLLVAAAPSGDKWTRAWTSSNWPMPVENAQTVENVTLTSSVRVAASGSAIRIRLGNDYGTAPVKIGRAFVSFGGKRVAVTFGGSARAVIGAGAPLVSDPVALPVTAFGIVEVSLYLPEKVVLNTLHDDNANPTLYVQGDHPPAVDQVLRMGNRPLLAGIDVLGAKARPVVVAVGDSITDNPSCPNEAEILCRWPDVLARRMAKAGMPQVVISQAISGNRVLAPGWGPSTLARFDRDVLSVPGVTYIILLEGINDIGNSGREKNGATNPVITAADLIAGYRQIILRAHERGIKVIGMTILPFEGAQYYAPEREAIRVAVNQWIRTSGAFDGVIDMDKVMGEPGHPKRLAAGLQGGDNLHPDGRGHTRMGEAIDLRLFK
ncbi:SGNH/GDSL hydrolase family protein [Sphingomonas sp. LB-2]|uniref:SGNH/GDSL hydrolase family protein n=1 Tax=Sphingomonas caeni TaxID=2984949 RepID=UPI0022303B55|nr:SGNH/GDSL hydrolase family protein [Sphingomonas caeni]MCW3849287.1 SGNH/GDSL hydrolase family protein [Sphingomonas caeni]